MTKKTTKRALLLSVISMMLCVAMLVGSTFAWFTDSVTSAMNTIVAGNLDVELYHTNARIKDTATDEEKKVGEKTTLFVSADENFKWEPGAMLYENFTVENAGSLALKYKLMLNAECNSVDGISLSKVLKVAVLNEAFDGDRAKAMKAEFNMTVAEFVASGAVLATGELLNKNDTKDCAVIIYWEPSNNDDLYNFNKGQAEELYIKLGVNLVATQAASESDSFDKDYDKDSEYPIVLPSGITVETFEENNALAYAGGEFFSNFTDAVQATEGIIYLKPNAELTEQVTHAHVIGNLTIYGNGASLTNGKGEHDLEIDTYQGYLKDDVTINIYNLDGIAVWGQRNTEYTANINLYNCHDIERVYISGAKGINNISLTNCSASSFGTACKVYSNAAGEIKVTNCSFDTVCEPVNFNNKSAGVQNIYITDCTFTNCSTADITIKDAAWAAPIRAIAAGEKAVTNLYLKGNKFVYTDGKSPVNNVNVLTEELREDKKADIKGTVNIIDTIAAPVNPNGETKLKSEQISVTVPQGAAEGDTLVLTMEPADKPDNFTVEVGNKTTLTFEINMEGLKADNTEAITVELFVGKNLEGVELYHYSEKVENATYDIATGYISFKTTSFSPFTAVYSKASIEVSNETELRNALNDTSPVFIKLKNNITISETVNITKDVNLDLNGMTITNDVSASRVFFVTEPNVTLTIDSTKEGSGIHTSETADGKTYGIVDMRAGSAGSKLVINGGTYDGNTDNGALFKVRDYNVAVELNNVTATTNRWVFDTNNSSVVGTTLTVNGGHFTSTEPVSGNPYSVFKFNSIPNNENDANLRFTDTTIVSAGGACIDLNVGIGEFNNCNFTVTNPSNPAHTASAMSVSNGSIACINGGTYTSDGYGAYVYTSGGTIVIDGGAVITGKAKALACSAASYYYESGQIILNDGTINGDIYAYNDGDRPADIIINGGSVNGSFSTKGSNSATIHIYGGLFTADPTDYIDEETNTYVTENGDGTWSVATIDEGDFEDPFGD